LCSLYLHPCSYRGTIKIRIIVSIRYLKPNKQLYKKTKPNGNRKQQLG
jgi:hypothetical protein